MRWGYHPNFPPPGRYGAWVRRGPKSPGRRVMPEHEVIMLWNAGFSACEIVERIGSVGGMRFCYASVGGVICRARRRGAHVEPHRPVRLDDFYDPGISPERQRALGL